MNNNSDDKIIGMITKYSYKEITYLLCCYIIIADKEINQMEVEILDQHFPLSKDDDLYKTRLAIFSDDEDCIKEKDLIYKLKLQNFSNTDKSEMLRFLIQVAFADNFVSSQEMIIIENVSTALNCPANDILNEEASNSNKRIKEERLSGFERTIGHVENYLYNNFADKNKSKTTDLLIGSLAYSTALEKITDTASVDLDRVSSIMSSINSHLTNTYISIF